MKDLFLRFCRWALPILGISAAVSCDNVINTPDMYGCPPAEYGAPIMEFRVSGVVTDADTGEPVKGIAVSCDQDYSDPDVVTTENGEFVYESEMFPAEKVLLKFKDANSGEDGYYFDDELEVALTQIKQGSGVWDDGFYIANDVKVNLYQDTVVAEYGVPMVMFSVKGRVVDPESNPIPNIEVGHAEWFETVRTAEDGTFDFKAEIIGSEMESATLKFSDVDGEENGGEFETEEVDIPLTQSVPGDKHWNNGVFSATDVEIVLEKI